MPEQQVSSAKRGGAVGLRSDQLVLGDSRNSRGGDDGGGVHIA